MLSMSRSALATMRTCLWLALMAAVLSAPAHAQVQTVPLTGWFGLACQDSSGRPIAWWATTGAWQCPGSVPVTGVVTDSTYASSNAQSLTRPANTTTYTANTG